MEILLLNIPGIILNTNNEDYLKKIVPDLEALAQKITTIFESYLNSILAAKLEEQLKQRLWREVTKEVFHATG